MSRRFLLCPPTYFDVTYAINPWMDPTAGVDRKVALRQWEDLARTYMELGHVVSVTEPHPDLPDMVFAANGGVTVAGRALASRFATAERAPEAFLFGAALVQRGYRPTMPQWTVEGEGDLVVTPSRVLAGHGFRSDRRIAVQAAAVLGVEVVSLRLVDPAYYHLDTALFALGDTVAWYPDAFDRWSQQTIESLYPDAVVATAADAAAFGLNAVDCGNAVVVPDGADGLADAVAARGHTVVTADTSELRKAGGGPKCCTLELR